MVCVVGTDVVTARGTAKEDLDAESSRFRNPDWDDYTDDSAVPGEDWSPYWDE